MLAGLIAIVISAIKVAAKAIGYFLLYTLPVQFAIAGFVLGGVAGNAAAGDKYQAFFEEESQRLTHVVTIQWSDAQYDKSEIRVREDLNWTINGADLEQELYYASNEIPTPSVNKAAYDGKTFAGLYTAPDGGGTQFVNAKGYSVRTVTSNLTLYPYWE